jgi:heterodisulfide reductase subunit A-like polyferredoxin
VAGPFAEPKDIPETVMQASAAAAQVLSLLKDARGTQITPKVYPPERDVTGEEPRIGVFVCHCGTNIAGVVNVPDVVEYAKTLPNVVYAENNLYTCSNDTQDRIKEKISEHNLNRVVVASCTPRTHEPLFRNTIAEAGLNPYLFEMANIRDQCSWVHMHEPEKGHAKSKDLVRMAVAKSRLLQPLQRQKIRIQKIRPGHRWRAAGMTAALTLARQGSGVYLVEKRMSLAVTCGTSTTCSTEKSRRTNWRACATKSNRTAGSMCLPARPSKRSKAPSATSRRESQPDGKTTEVTHGVVIVATGAEQYEPKAYLYGQDDRVITQRDLEARLASGNGFLALERQSVRKNRRHDPVRGFARGRPPLLFPRVLRRRYQECPEDQDALPATNVYVLYRDIRTYGFKESYYTKARQQGVVFVRYDEDRKPEVSRNPRTPGHRLRPDAGHADVNPA